MKVSEAIEKRRSIRKFKDEKVPYEDLKDLVEAGRLAPSADNKQLIEYLIVDRSDLEKEVFKHTEWAGRIEWSPSKDERPRAYILLLIDKDAMEGGWYKYDVGGASENISLAATSKGLGTCILGAIDREAIKSILNIPDEKRIDLAIAVGVPDQTSTSVDSEEGRTKYRIDDDEDFHVPKRKLEIVLHRNQL